jgi:hypothetical protein
VTSPLEITSKIDGKLQGNKQVYKLKCNTFITFDSLYYYMTIHHYFEATDGPLMPEKIENKVLILDENKEPILNNGEIVIFNRTDFNK